MKDGTPSKIEELTVVDVVLAEELWVNFIQMHSFPQDHSYILEWILLDPYMSRILTRMVRNSSKVSVVLPTVFFRHLFTIPTEHSQPSPSPWGFLYNKTPGDLFVYHILSNFRSSNYLLDL